MDRVSEDESKIVVKVADEHLVPTRYGFALILDCETVCFLREWAVSMSYYGNEVLLSREYFKAKKWGDFSNLFGKNEEHCTWQHWLRVAKGLTSEVRWSKAF